MTIEIRETAAPTLIDLFCGVGGFSLGAVDAGFDVRLAADNWSPAAESYRLNFAHPFSESDLRQATAADLLERARLEVGQLDVLVGGPPCQGFSIQRIGSDSDERNDLVLSFIGLAIAMQPRLFVMENVRGLIGRRGLPVLARARDEAARGGYQTEVVGVDAVDFGVAQHRRRIFVIGTRRDLPTLSWSPAPSSDHASVWDAIGNLPAPSMRGEAADDPLHIETSLSELNRRRLALIPPGGGFEDLPVELRVPAHRRGAARIGHRSVYGRLHPDRPASTITARFDSFTRGRFAHPRDDRNITLREGARLQAIPDEHVIRGTQEEIAAQIGNAVPPPMANAVLSAAIHHLRGEQQETIESVPRLFDVIAAS